MSQRWPDLPLERYTRAKQLCEEWPDRGIHVALVLTDPKKYPVAWARATPLSDPDMRVLTLAIPGEDCLAVDKQVLTARATFSGSSEQVTYTFKIPWGCVVNMAPRTAANVTTDRQAVARRRAVLPSVRLLQDISTKTDLLSPEELKETK